MNYWDGVALYIDHPGGTVIPSMRRGYRLIRTAQVALVLTGCGALVVFVRLFRRRRASG
jgi:hypothetical protein